MSINDQVKKIVKEYLSSIQPVAVMYGSVTNTNPLEVNVDQRLTFTADFLIIPEHIGTSLEPGAKLILLREAGGEKFVAIGRLMD
ncbi:uncharacterized protein DUF2577 [Paenibacillus sp. BK033]|uniref:DUF2577 family protein n=1 Tax=Paenibacillus sp. BK033 TaxID=2512133 RepID=UPI00104C14E1|nr:DUF2577 family protein [Paenibacillus sp. BK033]TCM93132.1 uncharacterized protein DUF2577 [Paenibacillus sp. BK033]